MTRPVFCLLLGLTAVPALAPPALAEDPSVAGGPIATLDLASRLYAHALASDDALAAVTAFRLVQTVTLRDGAGWEKSTADTTGAEFAGRALPPVKRPDIAQNTVRSFSKGFSTLALLAGKMEAATRELAAGNDDLLALVDDAAAETARGRVGGANQQVVSLAPGKKDTWQIPFAGKERAEIGVFGDGTGGLAWVVSDSAGLTVCLDPYSEAPLYCAFTPSENAFYTVTVISRSDVHGQYLLATN